MNIFGILGFPPHRGLLMAALLLPISAPGWCSESTTVNGVEVTSLGQVTRVSIQTSEVTQFRTGRLRNPDRLYFDILGATFREKGSGVLVTPVNDPILKRIRVAQNDVGVTRVVLDLHSPVEFATSQAVNPVRLIIELRSVDPDPEPSPKAISTAQGKTGEVGIKSAGPTASRAESSGTDRPVIGTLRKNSLEARPTSQKVTHIPSERAQTGKPRAAATPPCVLVIRPPSQAPTVLARLARQNRSGRQSLTRTLGLRVNRVVLDPGHGGYDTGAIGRSGLMEKDLVLDVSQRLGELIEEQLNSDVIYTRSEDAFVPLEERSEFAREKGADLLISIHANWSTFRSVAGIETYYLNLTDKESALNVASRENAGARKSLHELQNLIQQIALNENVNESRKFAASVQLSLFNSLSRTNAVEKSRGVKEAPFVVLLGSNVPSILVEIGFLSNPQEEDLLNRSEHRQRIAEAIYNGVSHYIAGLSEPNVAQGNSRSGKKRTKPGVAAVSPTLSTQSRANRRVD